MELIERYYISLELASGGTLSDWIGIPFLNFDMMKETDVIHCVKYVPYPLNILMNQTNPQRGRISPFQRDRSSGSQA